MVFTGALPQRRRLARRVCVLHGSTRTVILPRNSTPGSAPSVGGSQVGPAEVVDLGVSSPESAADAGPPSPSGRPTTSDDDGDDEDEEEFETVPNLGPLLADQAATRRESVSTWDDFLVLAEFVSKLQFTTC
eukprot:COSAG06_NODE_1_length_58652_cov_31.600967_5_plen_132_part_00